MFCYSRQDSIVSIMILLLIQLNLQRTVAAHSFTWFHLLEQTRTVHFFIRELRYVTIQFMEVCSLLHVVVQNGIVYVVFIKHFWVIIFGYINDNLTLSGMLDKADCDLFSNMCRPKHCLHHVLPHLRMVMFIICLSVVPVPIRNLS